MRLVLLTNESQKRVPQDPFAQVNCSKHNIRQCQTQKFKPKGIRTSHVLWVYTGTGQQRTFWGESELVRVKLRIKSVLVKMDVQPGMESEREQRPTGICRVGTGGGSESIG